MKEQDIESKLFELYDDPQLENYDNYRDCWNGAILKAQMILVKARPEVRATSIQAHMLEKGNKFRWRKNSAVFEVLEIKRRRFTIHPSDVIIKYKGENGAERSVQINYSTKMYLHSY